MFQLAFWQSLLLGLVLVATAVLLAIWWRQQSLRWWIVLALCLFVAPVLSLWSGMAFHVADYRAGCDGLCPGFRGAPLATYRGEAAGGGLVISGFLLNTLIYLVVLLGWAAVVRAILRGSRGSQRHGWAVEMIAGLALLVIPLALSPLVLPPPEAHVRGDPQRIAINARREVYLYNQLADWPILRVGLEDVRPRRDDQPGMRVCLRAYTFFYLPVGSMFLDMTPEGVHSNNGGVLSGPASCWQHAPE